MSTRTMSDNMDAWLDCQETRLRPLGRSGPDRGVAEKVAQDAEAPPCAFSEAEIDWLWPKLQRCSFGWGSWANRFVKNERANITPRGKAHLHTLAHRVRRQIFGRAAAKWHIADTVEAIQRCARGKGETR